VSHLQGKTVLITGASSGIGFVTARTLAARGARVVATALDQEGLDLLVRQVGADGGAAVARAADVTVAEDMLDLAGFAADSYGSVDVLVNNAGLMLFSYWKECALDDWNRMIDVNIRGYLHAIRAVLPGMLQRGSGHILNISSVAGHQVGDGAGVYSATKFFVHAMTESLRKEIGVREGVRISSVSPGVISTGWHDKVTDPEGRSAAQELVGIAIAPERVAEAVAYALDQPADVTVNDIVVSPTRQNW
jgi:NADP-dependent 3-hydroxy acid dehydrogenase YdfG